MAQHTSYWSCSKFADWLRGTPKPYALEWDAWDEWREEAKAAHPWRYWLAEEALGKVEDIIFYPQTLWRSIDAYCHNRWIDKTHYLKTGLKPGTYADFDYRVMHGLMNELVLYVECELAGMYQAWHMKGKRRQRRSKWFGLAYLEWEMALVWDESACIKPGNKDYGKPTHQAVAAKETMALYRWWTEIRPNRPDPYDNDDLDYKQRHEIEEQFEREDNAYLVRLILNRRSMWT